MMRLARLGVLVLVAMVLTIAPVTASSAPIRLTFDKSMPDPQQPTVWVGTVSGAVEGDLTSHLLAADNTHGLVLHITFRWEVDADDPSRSFVAETTGILNPQTGRVVMNGTVVSGWMAGARVHEEGQLIDLATARFRGTITILPATS